MQIPSLSSELEGPKEARHAGGVPLLESWDLSKLSVNSTRCLILIYPRFDPQYVSAAFHFPDDVTYGRITPNLSKWTQSNDLG